METQQVDDVHPNNVTDILEVIAQQRSNLQ